MSNTFIQMLKKYTTIDKDFINTFFKKFKIGDATSNIKVNIS